MERKTTTNRLLTGVPGLDDVLHGGLIQNRLYLVEGNPGAGKTTLALQFLREGVRLGERCLYVTLSETREELAAGAQSHGLSLDDIDIIELSGHDDDLSGNNELTMYHPSEVELTETTREVLQAIERIDPRRMVFDSLSEMRLLAQSSLRYRRQILALKQFFVARNCTVLLLDDRTADGADLQLQSIAHGVISLDHRSPPYGQAVRRLQVIKYRGSDFRSGFHDMSIRQGGIEIYPRLTAAEHRNLFVRESVASGVKALDDLLGGGVDRGTTTLLVGPPGCGKSTVAMQYAQSAAQRGDHAAIYALDESRAILLDRAKGLGMKVVEGTGLGQVMVRQVDPTEISPGEFAAMVRTSVERDQARVVVIDSLNGYLHAMPDDQFLTAQLHELLAYLNNHGVATFLVAAQSGLMGMNMRSPVDASYLADAVVVMRMYEHEGKVKKAVSALKKRSGHHEESIRQMWFDQDGVHLSEPLAHLRGVMAGVPVDVSKVHAEVGVGTFARPHEMN